LIRIKCVYTVGSLEIDRMHETVNKTDKNYDKNHFVTLLFFVYNINY
jgi:hypothetical protein